MRILLTEVAGRLGRAVAQGLLAAGHEVYGIAERRHPGIDPAVDFVGASLDHPVLYDVVAESDVVIQLPANPAVASQSRTVRVCDAAARSGARVIFPSFSLLEPQGWLPAEHLVSTSWAPNLIVRMALPVGRQVDAAVCRTVATLLSPSFDAARVLHLDDLVRFLVVAVDSPHSGVVELGASGMLSSAHISRVFNGVDTRLETRGPKTRGPKTGVPKTRGLGQWTQLAGDMDLEKVHDLWGFECGWGAAEALTDTARGLRGRKLTSAGAVAIPGEFPLPIDISPGSLSGAFDDHINAQFPVFVAARFNQAQHAPLTPMSLDLHMSGLRSAGRQLAGLLGLRGAVAEEWENRLVGAFGQRIYFGASAVAAAESQLSHSGIDVARRLRAAVDPDVDVMVHSPRAKARFSMTAPARIRSAARTLGHHVEVFRMAAAAEHSESHKLAALRDAQLDARIRMLRNRVYEGWSLWAAGLLLSGRSEDYGPGRISADIAELVTVARAHPYILSMIDAGDVAAARIAAPMFGTTLDRVIAQVGHHGPGEIDLAAMVFADCPEIVVQAVQRALANTDPVSPPEYPGGLQQQTQDAAMAFTHQLRLAVRELARRRVAAQMLQCVEDIFYLTTEEALVLPEDAQQRIEDRSAEREMLRGLRPPTVIEGEWAPLADPGVAALETELRGRQCHPGTATGTIRVVRSVLDLPVRAGEIAVVAAADTGYAVLMGTPCGVIVDGDAGADIEVAEFRGLPAIFLTGAGRLLRSGMRVRVDGTSGVVRIVADEPAENLMAVR